VNDDLLLVLQISVGSTIAEIYAAFPGTPALKGRLTEGDRIRGGTAIN
jgi:hypothetical protein